MEDTLLATMIPAFAARPKRRVIQAPKFYFRNVGITNSLLRRKDVAPGTEVFGKAFENWVCHELSAHSSYSDDPYPISYWRLTSGIEVDFVLGDAACAIELKGTDRVREHHLKGLESFRDEYPEVKERVIVCLEQNERKLENGIWIMPIRSFLSRLWNNQWPTE